MNHPDGTGFTLRPGVRLACGHLAPLFLLVLWMMPMLSGCGGNDETDDDLATTQPEETERREITLTPDQIAAIGVEMVLVAERSTGAPLELPGRVLPEPDHEAYVTSLLAGRIERVYANAGDRVQAGAPVVSIASADLGSLIAALRHTRAERDRQQRLTGRGVGVPRNLDEARTNYAAARQALRAVGFPAEEIETLATGEEDLGAMTLTAPISGYVLERKAVLGGPVASGETLMHLVDLTPILVEADVYERDLERIRDGMTVAVTAPSEPTRTFEGRITQVVPRIDPERRAATVRILLANPDGLLKPGMFATVRVPDSTGEVQPALPAEAIRTDGFSAFVLIAVNDTTFRRQDVLAPVDAAGFVAVPELPVGTRVVTTGGYQIISAMTGVEADDD